jgi:hypothetical protein
VPRDKLAGKGAGNFPARWAASIRAHAEPMGAGRWLFPTGQAAALKAKAGGRGAGASTERQLSRGYARARTFSPSFLSSPPIRLISPPPKNVPGLEGIRLHGMAHRAASFRGELLLGDGARSTRCTYGHTTPTLNPPPSLLTRPCLVQPTVQVRLD